jgi:hypothetical protein
VGVKNIVCASRTLNSCGILWNIVAWDLPVSNIGNVERALEFCNSYKSRITLS